MRKSAFKNSFFLYKVNAKLMLMLTAAFVGSVWIWKLLLVWIIFVQLNHFFQHDANVFKMMNPRFWKQQMNVLSDILA